MYCNFVGHRATFSGRDFLEERGAKKPLSKETFNLAVLLYCIIHKQHSRQLRRTLLYC